MKLIAPSILSADFSKLGDEIRAVEAAGADWIHVDVMDGHLVPNITMGPMIVEAARRVTDLPMDVHLMIEHPDRYIPDFAKAGASMVSVHVEACVHLTFMNELIKCICIQGIQAAFLSIKLQHNSTPAQLSPNTITAQSKQSRSSDSI